MSERSTSIKQRRHSNQDWKILLCTHRWFLLKRRCMLCFFFLQWQSSVSALQISSKKSMFSVVILRPRHEWLFLCSIFGILEFKRKLERSNDFPMFIIMTQIVRFLSGPIREHRIRQIVYQASRISFRTTPSIVEWAPCRVHFILFSF